LRFWTNEIESCGSYRTYRAAHGDAFSPNAPGFGGDYRHAEMVKAFLDSAEYRKRFGQ